MSDRRLTARDLIGALALLGDVDAPVIVEVGPGRAAYTVTAVGQINPGDCGLNVRRTLHSLVVGPLNDDRGPIWPDRRRLLLPLLDRAGELT